MDLFSYFRGLDEGDNEDGIISWMLASRVVSVANLIWAARGESVGWGVTGEWYNPTASSPTSTEPADAERLG